MASSMKDKRILVIVESPVKSKHITEYLKNAGYTKAVVMASIGHIMQLKARGKAYNTGVDADNDFKVEYVVVDEKKDVVKRLKEQADAAELVYLMTDPDREGESIAWSLIKFLKLKKDKYVRCVTHEITPKAVINAIENPIKLNDNLVDAAEARRIVDILIGYGITPNAKAYIGAKSVGRVQSAALKIVVDREKEIQEFKPETFFDVYLNFNKNGTAFKAKYVGTDEKLINHLPTQADVNIVKFKCSGDYTVKDISKRNKQESPKPPFCTSTFQQEASSKLGLKVKDAMKIAQDLFHAARISYIRTDDTEFSQEFVDILKPYIEKNYKEYVQQRVGKKSGNEQLGHECLRVTDPEMTPEKFKEVDSNNLHQKVYNLIWQRTIAACLPNAIISETTYNIYNNDQKFNLVSNEIVSPGYRIVYNYNDNEDAPTVKETFSIDEVLQDCSLEDVKKSTQPPSRFTEAALVKKLNDLEIGRPSTYATAVETVTESSRGYTEVEDKKIVPTDKGIQLSNYLDRKFSNVINLNYTRDLEACLDEIAEGELSKVDFLRTFYNELKTTIDSNTEVTQESKKEQLCPICGSKMVIRRSRFGKLFYGCSNYPSCRGIVGIE